MRRLRGAGRALVALAGIALIAVVATGGAGAARGDDQLQKINHIVVIYEENHSFDNLYGGWEGVNGLANADAAHTTQVDQNGTPYSCLFQLDVNLTSPPLSTVCSSTTPRGVAFNSHFLNAPFTIDDYIPADATTCPKPKDSFAFTNGILNGSRDAQGNLIGLPGGCTRDIVHKFYQEQYQLNGGAQNRYATGSDAAGLVMGVYNTRSLPIYQYLHANGHPHYAIADNFFQAAFGGSFLNHQWLIAARTPVYPNAPANLHSLVGLGGFPRNNYPLYNPLAGVTYRDSDLTVTCDSPVKPGGACGNYAVNTMQPTNEPFGTFGDKLPVQDATTIGDELSAADVSWGWYAGGWTTRPATRAVRAGRTGLGRRAPTRTTTRMRRTTIRSARTSRSSSTISHSRISRTTFPGRRDVRTCVTRWRSRTRPARRRASATSTRSASSSRSARRTSTPATPASRRAART
jgi:phospholipase C